MRGENLELLQPARILKLGVRRSGVPARRPEYDSDLHPRIDPRAEGDPHGDPSGQAQAQEGEKMPINK